MGSTIALVSYNLRYVRDRAISFSFSSVQHLAFCGYGGYQLYLCIDSYENPSWAPAVTHFVCYRILSLIHLVIAFAGHQYLPRFLSLSCR